MRVTLKDVASHAGVDVATVSRALNNSYGVRDSTRQRILAVAGKLQYHPNRIARGLATGRSRTLALVISDIRNPFFAEFARGAEDTAYAAGYDLLLCNSDLNPGKQIHYVRSLLGKRVEGIVMNTVSTLSREFQEELIGSGVPVVLLNKPLAIGGFSTVTADNFQGGKLAGQYLIRLGHRSIAHLTGPSAHSNLRERAKGFLHACKSAPCRVNPIVIRSNQSSQGGYDMVQKLLSTHQEFTALFTGNDAIAFGAIRALREHGLSIPKDISVIGFDNVEIDSVIQPPLTSIHQPRYEMGEAALGILLKSARHREGWVPEHHVLEVKLVERESCRSL